MPHGRFGHRASASLAAFVLCIFGAVASADWPNFRGPNYDGVSGETGFKKLWTGPLPLVWERKIGSAFSSFACVGNRVYTCGTEHKQQVLFCLDADTGAVRWKTPIEPEFHDSSGGDGTRATPTVEDGKVYILGALGALKCLDADSGAEIWSTKLEHMPYWGYSGSVLIEGDLAIATGGLSNGVLAAFDKKTGKPAWQCGDDIAGYATPYPFRFNGRRYVVGFAGSSVIIADVLDGRQVLRMPWETDWKVNAAAPIVHDGHLFLTSGYSTGCGLFKLRQDGENLALDQVWKSTVLLNKFQSCVLHEGYLYTSDQKALVCVEFLTGKERWRQRRVKNGTVLLADGHLLVLTQDGKLRIAKADPNAFEPLTNADILTGRCWTVPVLHRGKLYARNLERAVCFDLTSKEPAGSFSEPHQRAD